MKIIGIFIIGWLAMAQLPAQIVGVKKLQISSIASISNTVEMFGNAVNMPLESTALTEVELKLITNNSGVGTITTKNVKGKLNMMGQDVVFNSDDSASVVSNPILSSLLNEVGKPQNFTVTNGRLVLVKNQLLNRKVDGLNWESKLFLPVSGQNIKQGYRWIENLKDSSGSSAETAYEVTKLYNGLAEISAIAKVKLAAEQNGITVKQNLEGYIKEICTYDVATTLLKTALQTNDLSGIVEAMGQQLNMHIKGKIQSEVK